MRLEVGRIARAHGLRGDVIVVPITNRPGRFVAGSHLWLGERELTIAASRPYQRGHLVRFEGVDDRTAAETLRGGTLTAETPGAAPPGEVWVHEVVGAEVVDRDERVVGTVVAVQANPAHDLLELDNGALVPMVFVVDVGDGRVTIDPPEGLFDL
jgi:16S rRNA processing protein RimM